MIIDFSETFIPKLKLPSITIEDQIPSISPFLLTFNSSHPDISSAISLFQDRYSPKEFTGETIPIEVLSKIVEAANRSPSAGNLQAYSVILVLNRDCIQKISKICHQQCVTTASGLFIVISEPDISAAKYKSRGRTFYSLQDATIHCSHLQLALEEFGLHSRWIGAFDDNAMKSLLNLDQQTVAAVLLFGYPKSSHTRISQRRKISDYVTVIK